MADRNFNAVTLIRKKRDGSELDPEEISYFIDRFTRDELPDYQMSALLMAIYLNGLNDREATALTEAMLYSGTVLDLSDIAGTKVDKHSTGGVGDKLSLILAPIVASYGVPVPMISGRGLGHTGGTLDKLESITGFTVDINLDRYREILARHRMVMAGQTEEIAPADKRLYALRDVTGTVESIPLIAGSIMSKKLAEGIDALVLDVKFGSGAFMKRLEDALELAEALVGIGEQFDKQTVAWVTNMEQPLGYQVGNWLEAREAIESLRGNGPDDVMTVTHRLAGTMIWLGGKADSWQRGVEMSRSAIDNGQAMEKWRDLVEEQGGDIRLLDDPGSYPEPEHHFEYKAGREGFIQQLSAYEVGMASLEMGGGRREKGDTVDPAAGITLKKKIGDFVTSGETLAVGYTNNNRAIEVARDYLARAYSIGSDEPQPGAMISHRVDKNGVHELKS